MCSDGEPIYVGVDKVHPRDQETVDRLTKSRNWDYPQFRRVVVALATVGQYIPSYNRPDSICIQGLQPFIKNLKTMTAQRGKETARAVFADIGRKTLVVSGKTTVGTEKQGRLDFTPQPGRERWQKGSLSIHAHPVATSDRSGHGLSNEDYFTLLSDRQQLGMFMVFGESVFLALKTSVTPNNLSESSIKERINDAWHDYLEAGKARDNVMERVVNFNKAVCSEFGLTLYLATVKTGNLANRVEVTR